MSARQQERGGEHFFGSKKIRKKTATTTLPPRNYLHMKENRQIETPNLINIYRHEYKSKHFKFGTALSTQQYKEEVEKTTNHCNKMIKELDMTGHDLQWVGDETVYNEKWPMKSNVLRIAQLNVNGLSFAQDNYKIDMYLQGLMAYQVDIAAMQEINLNLNKNTVREKFTKAMKRFDKRATLQLAYTKHEEKDQTYMPGGNAIF